MTKRKAPDIERESEERISNPDLYSALREGVNEDMKEENVQLIAKGKRPKYCLVEFTTRKGEKVALHRTPRVHRLTEEQQLKRIMTVINQLTAADVIPTTKNIKLMGIGAG